MNTKIITVSSGVVEMADLLKYENMILENANISEPEVSKFFAFVPKISFDGWL
ncbi:MAG: hypothetical protein BWY28_01936 [bacterium ADurb.Bin236]|nr:MAG: hypothetical protein BWY28_01936 [bacterium ADurb.Bin236]HOY62030.1 hypothetical protein [bacterium]